MERLKESRHLEDMGVDGRIVLQWTLKYWCEDRGPDAFSWRQGQEAGRCEHGNEPAGSIKCCVFPYYMRMHYPLWMDLLHWVSSPVTGHIEEDFNRNLSIGTYEIISSLILPICASCSLGIMYLPSTSRN